MFSVHLRAQGAPAVEERLGRRTPGSHIDRVAGQCRIAIFIRSPLLNRRLSLRWFEPNTCHHQTRRSDPVRGAGSRAFRERCRITAPCGGCLGCGPYSGWSGCCRSRERLAVLAALLSRVVEQWLSSKARVPGFRVIPNWLSSGWACDFPGCVRTCRGSRGFQRWPCGGRATVSGTGRGALKGDRGGEEQGVQCGAVEAFPDVGTGGDREWGGLAWLGLQPGQGSGSCLGTGVALGLSATTRTCDRRHQGFIHVRPSPGVVG
jgi:hypothetical protein